MGKITKISDTELEIEEEPEKNIITKELIEKNIAEYKAKVARYEELLTKFN